MKPVPARVRECASSQSNFSGPGSRQRRFSLLVLAAVLAALALPVGAETKPRYEVHPANFNLVIPLGKRNGYSFVLWANRRRGVKLELEGPSSVIEYWTRGRVTSRHISADFGALGMVDAKLHFAFRHPPDPPHRGRCRGPAPIYWEGTYRGKIQFSGEPGIPAESSAHGHFNFYRFFRQVCRPRHPPDIPSLFPGLERRLERKMEEGLLTVHGASEGRAVRLRAEVFAFKRHPAYSGGTFDVTAHEQHEGVRIIRRTGDSFHARHNAFAMSRREAEPETLTIDPPRALAGSAVYSQSPGSSPSWTGDLTIDLPGIESVPLTGPGFSAVFCRGRLNRYLTENLERACPPT